MKIRTDFVSNSSSSSFVLIGDAFDREDIEKSSFFKTDPSKEDDDYYNEDMWRDKCYDLGLSVEDGIDDYYEQYVIGLRYEDMKDDETKAAFYKRVEELLRKAFPEKNNIEVAFRKDSGYC